MYYVIININGLIPLYILKHTHLYKINIVFILWYKIIISLNEINAILLSTKSSIIYNIINYNKIINKLYWLY